MRLELDYKRDMRHLYAPKSTPEIVDVPSMRFLMLDGSGDPNGDAFEIAVEALYSISYAVRMSYKSAQPISGYVPYRVFPLEGVWDLIDRSRSAEDKTNLKYTLMIRQPEFLTTNDFERLRESTARKKPNPLLAHVRFEASTEGLCCQALHQGPFDDEPATFAKMEEHCTNVGYARASMLHREIYLSDPRRTEPARLKTVLRFQVHELR